MTTEALAPPPDCADSGEVVMTNFDGSIDRAVEARLRAEKIHATYAGWNFCGTVWFRGGRFHCLVWVCGSPREIFAADSLDELMRAVSDRHGHD